MTVNLVEFLRARLDEDERIARAATPGPWKQTPERVGFLASAEYWYVVDCSGTPMARENADHAAEWDPARVLAEVEAKRRLVDEYVAADERAKFPDFDGGVASGLDDALRILALPYSEHADYQDEWRPDWPAPASG